MASTDSVNPQGDKIRKAVRWISDVTIEHPEKSRQQIIREAEIKFDLSPLECEFLTEKFGRDIGGKD